VYIYNTSAKYSARIQWHQRSSKKKTKVTVKKCKKIVDGVNYTLRGDFHSSPDLKNTQTVVALSDLTRKA